MSKLSAVVKKISKENVNFCYVGDALWDLNVPRIPSGCFMFDLQTGGGIPAGRFTIFQGVKSSGKTTKALRIAGRFLKDNPTKSVLYVDFEHAHDQAWADHFIDDPDRFYVLQPDYGEQGIDLLKECLSAEDVGLLIIDSLAMMIPTAEADASAGDDFMGLQARLINKMFRKIIPIISQAKKNGQIITTIMMNQSRANLKAQAFGAQTMKPGGYMQDHVASMDIKFYFKKHTKSKNVPVLATHTFTLEKNKCGIPKVTGEYSVFLAPIKGNKVGGLYETKQVISYAKRSDTLFKEDKHWNFLENVYPNLSVVQEDMDNNPELLESLKLHTMTACLLTGDIGEEKEDK